MKEGKAQERLGSSRRQLKSAPNHQDIVPGKDPICVNEAIGIKLLHRPDYPYACSDEYRLILIPSHSPSHSMREGNLGVLSRSHVTVDPMQPNLTILTNSTNLTKPMEPQPMYKLWKSLSRLCKAWVLKTE